MPDRIRVLAGECTVHYELDVEIREHRGSVASGCTTPAGTAGPWGHEAALIPVETAHLLLREDFETVAGVHFRTSVPRRNGRAGRLL